MPVIEKNGQKIWQVRDRKAQFTRWAMWMAGTIAFLWAWKSISDGTEWYYVQTAPQAANDIITRVNALT